MRTITKQEDTQGHQYLLIGGAPKSATTSIFRYLADHPQTCPAYQKETYFFAREFDFGKDNKHEDTLNAFSTYFKHCDPGYLRVEATPYTLYAKDAPQKIKALLPNVLMLFVLREPVDRFVSDYYFHVQREHPYVQDTIQEFVEYQFRSRGGITNLLELGCYVDYLRPFFDTIGRDNVHIMFYENFRADPEMEMLKLCGALGLDDKFYSNYQFVTYNRTINKRYSKLNKIVMGLEPVVVNVRKSVIHWHKVHKIFEQIVRTGNSVYHNLNDQGQKTKKVFPLEERARLAEFYRPYNEALCAELGYELPWKSYEPT